MDWQSHERAHGAGTDLSGRFLYFDTAAAAPPVAAAVAAATSYLAQTAASGPYLPSLRADVYRQIDEIRAAVASFVGAAATELAFTRNGTEAISLLARGLSWEPGDEIVIPDTEMISNVAVWRLVAQAHGARVVTVAGDGSGLISPDAIRAAITERTKIVTFAALSNVTGAAQPVSEICEIARAHGALSHVNAAQAIGLMPVGFHVWGCDFISACARKGLRGIEGSGLLAVREQHLDLLTPTLVGWWNAQLSDDGDSNGSNSNGNGNVVFERTAKKLEAGSPNVPAVLALGAAVNTAHSLGIDAIHTRVRELTNYAAARLRAIPGAELYGPGRDTDRLGILPFNVAGTDPHDLTLALERRGIIIEAGHFMAGPVLAAYGITSMARVSLHYFNTTAEIDTLVAAITAETGAKR